MSRKRSRGSKGNSEGAGSFLLRYGSMLLLAVLVIVVVLTLGSCTIRKPEAPQWDTQFVMPLVNRTYAMPELIRKMNQSGVGFDVDSNVVFSVSRQLDTIALNADNLSTDSLSYSISKQLGKVSLTPPTVSQVSVNISQISAPPGGYPATLPAFSFNVPAGLPSFGSFNVAAVDTGRIWVVMTNQFGLDLDSLRLTVSDAKFSTTLSTSSLVGGLADGATDSLLVNLGGKTISDSLSIVAACHTPGGTLASPTGKNFVVVPHFQGNLVVSSANAIIPAITRTVTTSLDLQETDIITDGAIASGTLHLSLSNTTPLTATIVISIPDLTLNGTPFSVTRISSAGPLTVDLAGYHLQPADITVPQSIPVNVQVTVPSTNPTKVTVSESQAFGVTASISNLAFASVTGTFSGTTATLDPIVRNIDVPKGFDSAQIVSAVVTLEVENGVGLPGTLNVNLAGNNGQTLNVSGAIAARTLATAATTLLTNANVGSFFAPIPSQVTISGSATFGAGQSGTIRPGDYITGRVTIEAPLEVILTQTPLETDVSQDSIDQKDISKVTDHVKSARFVYNLINHLPVGATVNVVISSDSATLYTNPELRFDSINVNAAPVINSIVSDTLSTGMQTISIDSAAVQILKHPVLYIGNELILHGSNGQTIRLTKNDYVTVQGRIEVEYRFDSNL
jgi:hypothetical protein